MSNERKGVEFLVGLFLLIGLGIIAVMVLVFGRLGQGMQKNYALVIKFPNANGLVKGCDVLISGARVGVVSDAPRLGKGNYIVDVPLSIHQNVSIPRNSNFQIRTNGMLGDAYVDVVPPMEYTEADYAQADEVIEGRKLGGLDELTTKGGLMMDRLNTDILIKLSAELDELKQVTGSVKNGLLNEKNLKNVEETFANLKELTAGFAKTGKDLDAVIARAQNAVDATTGTMKTADASAAELKLALTDLRKLADTATKTVDSAKLLINKASSGDGTFGALVADPQMAADLKALIANIRRSGVLFYKDRPVAAPAPAPGPAPPRRR